MATCIALFPKQDVLNRNKAISVVWSHLNTGYTRQQALAWASVEYPQYYRVVFVTRETPEEFTPTITAQYLRAHWRSLVGLTPIVHTPFF